MQLQGSYTVIAVAWCAASFALFSSCSSKHPPTPGETCSPSPDSDGACYDDDNLVHCERQSDGAYRWSEFLTCQELSRCSCSGGTHPKSYPSIEGACNCFDFTSPSTKGGPKPAPADDPPSTEEPPPPKPCKDGAAVCLDFEDLPLHAPVPGIATPDVSMTVEDTYAASGKHAMRMLLESPAPSALTEGVINFVGQGTQSLPPFPLDDVHGRLMIYAAALPAVRWKLINAQDAGDENSVIAVQADGSIVLVPNRGSAVVSQTMLPTGRWVCLQWETKRETDGSATISLQVDGQPVDLGGGAARHSQPFDALFVGFAFSAYGITPAPVVGEIWLDDISFGAQPIPCGP